MRIGKLEVTAPFFLMLAWLNYLDRQGLVPLCVLACCFHGLLAVFCGLNVAEQIGALLDGCLVGSLLLAGALLAWKNGNITLLSVGLWLLVVFSKGKKRGNRACLIDKKKVKSY